MSVCVCVCARERERERERVCVCVCERESIRQLLGSEVLCFLLMNVFHQNSLILENISLHLQIEPVVPVCV